MVLPMTLKWVVLMQILHCNVKNDTASPHFRNEPSFPWLVLVPMLRRTNLLGLSSNKRIYNTCTLSKSHSVVNQRHIFRLLRAGDMPVLHHHQGRFFTA